MLTQANIDALMKEIQTNGYAEIYYVAHMIEGRETNTLDEHTYKSVSDFKVVKVKVDNIKNAYIEYYNYKKNPDNYHEESEECYYDKNTKYIHYFTVPNGETSYTKDFNARIPAIIYGYRRKIGDSDEAIIDPSPVKEVYVKKPVYGNTVYDENVDLIKNNLDWKYIDLEGTATIDDDEYGFVTSDWYILNLVNYPMIEKPLINVNQFSCYFMSENVPKGQIDPGLINAFDYIEQLKA